MVSSELSPGPAPDGNSRWPSTPTRWSLVLAARDQDSPKAQAALEELCKLYWYPLYSFARRSGHTREDAEDLVQGFLARLLEKRELNSVDRGKGCFRSFLMTGLKNFAANEWDKTQTQKRGGGKVALSLDFATGEATYVLCLADPMTSGKQFDRDWAMGILNRVMDGLEREYTDEGKAVQFNVLKPLLAAKTIECTYAELAAPAGLKDKSNVKAAVHALRKRYRQRIRQEIIQTLVNPTDPEIDEEIRLLMAALSD